MSHPAEQRGVDLLFTDHPAARHAVNALAAAVEAAGRPESAVRIDYAASPAALDRACERARAQQRQALVAWSFQSAGFAAAAEALARLRARAGAEALHLGGGAHATAEPEQVLAAGFDLAAWGEGEGTLASLVERLLTNGELCGPGLAWREGGAVRRGPAPEPVDLDRIPPFPAACARGGFIEITRGCVHACRFCQTSFAKGVRLRHRAPEVVARWAGAQVRHGRPDVRFITPSALAYGSEDGRPRLDRVEELLLAVRREIGAQGRIFLGTFPSELRPEHVTPEALRLLRRHADNGALLVGAQSGSDRMLAAAHRGHGAAEVEQAVRWVLEAGFEARVDFILGLPGEQEEDRAATRRLMESLAARGARVHGHAFLPLPGTPWKGAPPGTPDERSARLLERLASRGRAFGQWKHQTETAQRLAALREVAP